MKKRTPNREYLLVESNPIFFVKLYNNGLASKHAGDRILLPTHTHWWSALWEVPEPGEGNYQWTPTQVSVRLDCSFFSCYSHFLPENVWLLRGLLFQSRCFVWRTLTNANNITVELVEKVWKLMLWGQNTPDDSAFTRPYCIGSPRSGKAAQITKLPGKATVKKHQECLICFQIFYRIRIRIICPLCFSLIRNRKKHHD